ncbi:CpsB/CapC family capsule biosynthesis tyrosine phosphatase [uncultured Fusobacterium sp.]|uniref:tyrosine-protein phosphatase n=1 Tax=uncultured Fusobacterium sp. TaxID=159267 RepID=UPI0025E9435F|nr:CpsB/CapC family capsule biosynthesis tyrosine phosphatase [uncultured Fusobacterium sp.]
MVDIHSHILFGVDDGAKDIGESIELLKQAVSVGYTDIVCSSHYYIGLYENEKYEENFTILENRIKELNIPIKILRGNEFNLDLDYVIHKKNINKINNGKYFLVEIKRGIMYSTCKGFFETLLQKGIIPIFAHVERYEQIKIENLRELSEMGVILQMNLKSSLSERERINYLLENRYIDVIATDSHSFGRRDYNIEDDLKRLKVRVGEEYFKILTEINPRKIINSEDIVKHKGERDEFKKSNRIVSFFHNMWNKLFR